MTKNTQVETTKKGQATNKNNTPTGKVKTLKSAEERRKAREEQFRNFRINALRRRCARMKMSDEDTEKYVAKLIEQMNTPKQYSILIMLNPKDMNLMKESMAKADIKYNYCSDAHISIDGEQNILAKLREIAPPSAKIHPYAKKMESVLPKQEKEVIKKPSNNTAEKKAAAAGGSKNSVRLLRRRQRGRMKNIAELRRAHRYVKKTLKKGEKIDVKKVLKIAEERQKSKAATTIQMKGKNASTGSKKASTSTKKAA